MEPPQTTTVKTPDPESEPPQSTTVTITKQPIPPPLTNGVLKRHTPLHHQPYKECMKNHAAAMGGHAIDGCGEFMSSPTYPTSLKCAACGCHRNFHRRDPDESLFPSPSTIQHVIEYQPHHRHHPPPPPPPPPPANVSPGNSPSPPPISSSYYPSAPHMLLALSSGVSAPPTDNNNHNHNHISPVASTGKKRFRTKFSQGQKEKMQEFAEQVGWKMHKRHEDTIFAFCNQIGVDKNVFKVWMHNNKSNSATKKDISISSAGGAGGEGFDFIISRNNPPQEHNQQHEPQLHLHNDSFSTGGGNVVCPKGSSTSS